MCVSQFEDVLNLPEPKEHLRKLVDPHLGDDYPFDCVWKVKQLNTKTYYYMFYDFNSNKLSYGGVSLQVTMLAKACTHENPQIRPSMRSIVVALMTLSSTTEDWDVGSFYNNQAMVNLMSGR